ncbi:hypothetical protein METBIDRAFT_47500, partial [Metschnikowia bicuspidata var. bicuspidata NRRL YB-4993]
ESNMETRKGLLTKLAGFSAVAIGLTVVGKKHIASAKEKRHSKESDASLDSDLDSEFLDNGVRPGFPKNNPNLNYESAQRESQYVGAGVAYLTRTKGDRLSLWNVIKSKMSDNDE